MLWDLFHDMRELQSEIDNLFEGPAVFPRLYYANPKRSQYPPMNLREDQDSLFLDVRLSGVDMENIQISIENSTLSIRGRKPAPEGIDPKDYHRRERTLGNFIRAVELPIEVDVDKVKADYEDGILTVTMPKAEAAKPKRIEVKVK